MQPANSSNAHKWMIGVIAFVFLSLAFNLFFITYSLAPATWYVVKLAAPFLVLALFLILETIFYKRNRYWLRPVAWLRAHIVCLYISIVILTIIRILLFTFLPYYVRPELLSSIIRNFSIVSFFVYWGALIIGHIFFIGVFIKTRAARKTVQQDAGNTTHLLDNILD